MAPARGPHEAGGRALPAWSVDEAFELMDPYDIATACSPCRRPACTLPTRGEEADAVRARAREVNESTARVAQEHPRRFGFFATLPLPDVDGALEETAYAFDGLGAVGVILLANIHGALSRGARGRRRSSPSSTAAARSSSCTRPSSLGPRIDGMPPFAADFLLDTTRAAYRLVRAGIPRRHPGLKIILAHAGGFVPYASHRLAVAMTAETHTIAVRAARRLRELLLRHGTLREPGGVPSLLAFAKPGHVLFGSDWPFAPAVAVDCFTRALDAYADLDAAGHAAVDRNDAAALFPRFAKETTR